MEEWHLNRNMPGKNPTQETATQSQFNSAATDVILCTSQFLPPLQTTVVILSWPLLSHCCAHFCCPNEHSIKPAPNGFCYNLRVAGVCSKNCIPIRNTELPRKVNWKACAVRHSEPCAQGSVPLCCHNKNEAHFERRHQNHSCRICLDLESTSHLQNCFISRIETFIIAHVQNKGRALRFNVSWAFSQVSPI